MSDTREQILNRLLAIAVEVAGFKSSVRNRGLRSNEHRPAMVLLDGDEAPVLTHGGRQNRAHAGRTLPLTPSIMAMKPELYILLDDRKVDESDEIGPDVNAFRVKLVKAIADDGQLLALLGSNGGIIYNGCATDLKSGGALSGQMRLDFLLSYTFFPTTNQQGAS